MLVTDRLKQLIHNGWLVTIVPDYSVWLLVRVTKGDASYSEPFSNDEGFEAALLKLLSDVANQ
jgi:hypothetical protein